MPLEVVLVRHAIAEPAAGRARDAARRLTPEGRRRMRRGAAGLLALVPEVKEIAASPLVRAAETARLVAGAAGLGPDAVVALPALAPGVRPAIAAAWLRARRAAGATGPIVLVGHEPHLSRLAALLLGARRPPLALKKGGACLLELQAGGRAGAATLRWLLGARPLRALGDGARKRRATRAGGLRAARA